MARGKSPFQPSIDFGLLKIRASYLSPAFQNPADLRNAAWRRNMTRCELFHALKTVFGRGRPLLPASDMAYRNASPAALRYFSPSMLRLYAASGPSAPGEPMLQEMATNDNTWRSARSLSSLR
jgi:hypothetical protein